MVFPYVSRYIVGPNKATNLPPARDGVRSKLKWWPWHVKLSNPSASPPINQGQCHPGILNVFDVGRVMALLLNHQWEKTGKILHKSTFSLLARILHWLLQQKSVTSQNGHKAIHVTNGCSISGGGGGCGGGCGGGGDSHGNEGHISPIVLNHHQHYCFNTNFNPLVISVP